VYGGRHAFDVSIGILNDQRLDLVGPAGRQTETNRPAKVLRVQGEAI
jgi:hypothetical protein